MAYIKKDFGHLLGTPGFSDSALELHLGLYEGYVNNVNKLNDLVIEMEKADQFGTPQYAELNRRFGWEWNGMRLHEYYFENFGSGAEALDVNSELYQKITAEFGSYEDWEKDFRSMGAMRGIGWVILYYDAVADRLFNVWINEHDGGHFSGARPLLIMDVFEHAYLPDYGKDRPGYIGAFFAAIRWDVVEKRYK